MEIKTTFTTKDGYVFEDEMEARKHEEHILKIEEDQKKVTKLSNGKLLTRNDIIEYFNLQECKNCTMRAECDALYSHVRMKSTDTFVLCDVIKMKYHDYSF